MKKKKSGWVEQLGVGFSIQASYPTQVVGVGLLLNPPGGAGDPESAGYQGLLGSASGTFHMLNCSVQISKENPTERGLSGTRRMTYHKMVVR